MTLQRQHKSVRRVRGPGLQNPVGRVPSRDRNDVALHQLIAGAVLLSLSVWAGDVNFVDDFQGRLGPGWSWVREHPGAWRVTEQGLEVRVEPGNMWGPANNARNVLVRSVPATGAETLEASVRVQHQPTEQYEQVDLVWYYDDSHMVKLGQELVDGRLSIVMGREEADRTRTIAILPLATTNVQLRLQVSGNRIRGAYRPRGAAEWQAAGECDLPVHGAAKVSLQCYQGPANLEHWARLTEFRLRRGTSP